MKIYITYINNEKVKPAPVVGKVLLKAVCEPFQYHFQDEDVGENLVCKLQHNLGHFSLFNVNVFKCL